MVLMLLYCIRHAESVYNSQGLIQGQEDPPLSPLGQRQAEALAKALSELPIDAIYASPLQRAAQTAQPVAAALRLELRTDDRLKELNAGVFQGKSWEEVLVEHPQVAARWKSRDPDYAIPGGESRRQLMERGKAALLSIRAAGHARVVVVAHGGTLTAALKALLEIPPQRSPFALYNAAISRISWPLGDDDGLQIVTLNDVEHLRRAGCQTRSGDL
jgi:probable phosphoglycerate mutase